MTVGREYGVQDTRPVSCTARRIYFRSGRTTVGQYAGPRPSAVGQFYDEDNRRTNPSLTLRRYAGIDRQLSRSLVTETVDGLADL